MSSPEVRDWLMVAFTAVIAIATIIYTVVTHRLWRATRVSADIARYSAFMTYMMTAANEIARLRPTSPETALFFENFLSLVGEMGVERFLEDIDLKTDKEAREYFSKIEGMFRAHGVDPEAVPWLRIVLRRIRRRPESRTRQLSA